MSYANVISAADAEIIANRRRAIKALSEDTMEQCFSSLFMDHYRVNSAGQSEVTKTQACAVGVLVKEFFGIDTQVKLDAYIAQYPAFDPYAAVAAQLGIENEVVGDYDDNEVTVRCIWRKNDHYELPFSSIAGWLKVRWGL